MPKVKFLVIIQARCDSTRLPSKVLKDIEGKTSIEHMLERVSYSKEIDEVMVATTINREDIPIVNLVSGLGFRVFAGSSDDVLDRYYQAAKLIQPEYVIRLTADCPLFDWHVLDEAIVPFIIMVIGSIKPNMTFSIVPIDMSPFSNTTIKHPN